MSRLLNADNVVEGFKRGEADEKEGSPGEAEGDCLQDVGVALRAISVGRGLSGLGVGGRDDKCGGERRRNGEPGVGGRCKGRKSSGGGNDGGRGDSSIVQSEQR